MEYVYEQFIVWCVSFDGCFQGDATIDSPSLSRSVDLQKIFTPAYDAEEISPQKNRK